MNAVYRGMDRDTLSLAYNNSNAVPDSASVIADMLVGSAAIYAARPCTRDLAYGPALAQSFDFFPADTANPADAPTFVFIHGGYWQSRAKEDFALVAGGPLGRGMNVVLAEYTLAPEASMTQIVAETGALLDHLVQHGHRRIVLCGHSAGGHLAAQYRSHPAVVCAMPVSGLVDLEPISLGALNDKLQLSADEIARFSPLRHIVKGAPTVVTVGADELPELVRHSKEYADACLAAGENVRYLALPGANHFSILFDLAQPDGLQMSALMQAMGSLRG
jgi:arylformamidase